MKLSEEYFKRITHENDIHRHTIRPTSDECKLYGLIREIEGKIEAYKFTLDDIKIVDPNRIATSFVVAALNMKIKRYTDQLTTIRKEAGL